MKKEKTKLRVIQILCIVSLIITVFSIQKTYAKYFEKVDTTYATKIKRWVINVNGDDIHNKAELNSVMTPQFFYNPHMNTNGDITDTTQTNLNNILVPGREGYFEFLIDYTSVDLPFRFQFDIKQLNTVVLEDFEVYGYAIIDSEMQLTETTQITDIQDIGITELSKVDGKYQLSGLTQQINPAEESEKQKRILVLFRWNDSNADTTDSDEQTGMNNSEDTLFAGEAIEGDSIHTNLNYINHIIITLILYVLKLFSIISII